MSSTPDCDVCGADTATKYCTGCTKNKKYCDACFVPPHSKPKNESHEAIDIAAHQGGIELVAEIQIHVRPIHVLKHEQHVFYEAERTDTGADLCAAYRVGEV